MAQMTDAELQRWLDQHGGETGRHDIEEEVDDPTRADSKGNPLKVKKVDRTEITAKDGATLTLRRAPGSLVSSPDAPQYDVVENTPPKAPTTAGQTEWHPEGTPDGQGGFDNSRPIMVRTVNGKREERSPSGSELKDWNEAQQRSRNPGGKTDADIQAEKDKADAKARQDRLDSEAAATRTAQEQRSAAQEQRAAAAANKADNKTDNVTGSDGKTYTRVTTVSPDGKTVSIKNFGPDGKEVGEIPGASKTGFGVEPEGAPSMASNPGQVVAGLRTYSTWLSGQVKLYNDSGGTQGVSPDDATKLMTRRMDLAEAAVKESQSLTTAQSGIRGQDITQRGQTLTDTQGRRSAAQQAQDMVSRDAYGPTFQYHRPGDEAAFVGAQQERLQNALGYAGAWGGLRESPETNVNDYPMLAQARSAAMAGVAPPAAAPAQPLGPASLTAPAAATPAPAPPSAPGQAAPKPVVVNPVGGKPLTATGPYTPPPLDNLPPPPVASTAAPPLGQGQDASTRPVPPAILAPYQDSQTQASPVSVPVDPNSAPYGGRSYMPAPEGVTDENGNPVNWQLPHSSDNVQVTDTPGEWIPYPSRASEVSMAPQQPLSPRFMQEARYGPGNYWDSAAAADELSQRLGIDPEIMRQAHASLYG